MRQHRVFKVNGPMPKDFIEMYNNMKDENRRAALDFLDRNEPIYAGCPNEQCYCTGACRKVVGWRKKVDDWRDRFDKFRKGIVPLGGTRKIADLPESLTCLNPSHKPPMHQVFSPGVYEHVCPGCGHITRFTVNRPVW